MKKLLQNYLKFWARVYLVRTKPKIVAVTGSVGKTTTKNFIYTILQEKYKSKIRKSEGNMNTEYGVPLAILGFSNSPKALTWLPVVIGVPFLSLFGNTFEVMVLELAADMPGDIGYLTSFIKPQVSVLTEIGPSHLEKFGTMDKIVEEKAQILRALSADGWAVLNIDNPYIKKLSFGGRFNRKTFALETPADLSLKLQNFDIKSSEVKSKIKVSGEVNFESELSVLPSKGNLLGALAAVSVAKVFELTDDQIKNGLRKLSSEKHRMNIFKNKSGVTIIDDSYNASPASMKAALDLLKLFSGRKIACIGDVRELGSESNSAHAEIGEYARGVADKIFSVGDKSKLYDADAHFENIDKSTDFVLSELKEGDILLVKASRAIGLDKIVEILRTK